jgi:phenylacetate-CoA ligase
MSFRANSSFLVWPPFIASQPPSLRNALAGLKQSQRWPAAKLTHGQRAQLMLLLEWAANRVPYYRQADWVAEKLGQLERSRENFWDIWRTLPVLTKAELREQGPRMNAPEVPMPHLPLGKTTTSGSTGTPVEVRTTALTRFVWDAMTVRENLWHRLDFSKRFGAIRYCNKANRDPRGKVIPSWGPPISQVHRTGPGGYIHIGYPVDVLAAWLRRFDPHYLLTYPTVAASLLDELGDPSAKPPSLEEIRFISEPLAPELKERLTKGWGIRVSEIYSANEVGNIAFQCPEFGRLHVQSEAMLLEVLDAAGNPCDVGEAGRVVITPLHNLATPLIRYDLGDYAVVGEPCACGRRLPVIGQVLGRVRNLVRTPDGRRYWPVGLGRFKSITSIRQFQYVQSAPDTIQLQLLLNRPLTEEERSQVVECVRTALGYPFRVEIVPVPEIRRGPTGKFEEFLSLLPTGQPSREPSR